VIKENGRCSKLTLKKEANRGRLYLVSAFKNMRRALIIVSLTCSIFLSLNCTRNPEKEEQAGAGSPQPGGAASPAGPSIPNPGPQIMQAAASGDTVLVTALLDTGTDVNTQSEFGVTPLMAASAKGHVDTVKVLLAQGSNVSLKDKMGLTARNYAENSGHKEVVEVLAAAGATQ
jgi:ankyrin repeat protein